MVYTHHQIKFVGTTDLGLIRQNNEDVYLALPEFGCFVIADGMGGREGGEIAAREAVESLEAQVAELFDGRPLSTREAAHFFQTAFEKANAHVYRYSLTDAGVKGMGTTLSVLFFTEECVILTFVGDSRIYRFREGLKQLTRDHTMYEKMEGERAGTGIPSMKHVLTRSIGASQSINAESQIVPIRVDDLFLLCSDGLTNYTTDLQIEQILQQSCSDLESAATALVEAAKEGGGGDNITLLLVRVES